MQIRYLIPILLTALLLGCSQNTPEAMLQDYMYRVGNLIEREIERDLKVADQLPLYPPRRERILATEDIRQGLLEVLDLDVCDLLPLIAQRNSSLGKVMAPSQKLVYELRFFVRIRDCTRILDRAAPGRYDSELLAQVRNIYELKKRNLQRELWNGIFTAQEMEDNYSRGGAPLPLEGDDNYPASAQALQHLLLLAQLPAQETDWTLPEFLPDLEQDYFVLYSNQFGARALKSLILLTVTMERTARAIDERLAEHPLCFPGYSSQKQPVLQNVFTKFYAGRFQPYLAKVHRQASSWLDLQEALLNSFELPPTMQRYYRLTLDKEAEEGLWLRYEHAREQHTKAWQRLLRQCQLMPGSPGI